MQKYYYYVQKNCLFLGLCRNITILGQGVPGVSRRAIFGVCEEILIFGKIYTSAKRCNAYDQKICTDQKSQTKKTYHCWGGAIILSYGQDGATVGLTSAFVHAFKYPTFSRWSGCQGAGAQCTGVRRRRHSQPCRTIKPSQTPHSLLQGGLVNTNNMLYCRTLVCFIFEIFEIEQFWISVSEYQSCLRHFANYYAGKAFFSPNCQDVAMINGRRSLSKK